MVKSRFHTYPPKTTNNEKIPVLRYLFVTEVLLLSRYLLLTTYLSSTHSVLVCWLLQHYSADFELVLSNFDCSRPFWCSCLFKLWPVTMFTSLPTEVTRDWTLSRNGTAWDWVYARNCSQMQTFKSKERAPAPSRNRSGVDQVGRPRIFPKFFVRLFDSLKMRCTTTKGLKAVGVERPPNNIATTASLS